MTFKQMTRAYIKEAKEKFEFRSDEAQTGPIKKGKKKVPSKEVLMDWIRSNYGFEDSKLHNWAKKNGWDVHEVEDMIYKLASERVRTRTNETK
jgi:hypothetical protein